MEYAVGTATQHRTAILQNYLVWTNPPWSRPLWSGLDQPVVQTTRAWSRPPGVVWTTPRWSRPRVGPDHAPVVRTGGWSRPLWGGNTSAWSRPKSGWCRPPRWSGPLKFGSDRFPGIPDGVRVMPPRWGCDCVSLKCYGLVVPNSEHK